MAAPAKLSRPLCCFALLALLCLVESAALGGRSFTADLIHRDSPSSPLRDPFATHSDLVWAAARRSTSRARHIWARLGSAIRYDLTKDNGDYYVDVSIGTPSLKTLLIVDTGSNFSWTQCSPCTNCFDQKPPIFAPGKSSTYKRVECGTGLCNSLARTKCDGDEGRYCVYEIEYEDKSFSKGDVANETFSIGTSGRRETTVESLPFGCGHDNRRKFQKIGSGILGLSGGNPSSLISSMDIGGKFGYCLVPQSRRGSSKISFGEDAVVSGPGTISTRLVSIGPYYIVNLEGVSIERRRFSYGGNSTDSEAKESNEVVPMVIDSGTTLTYLPSRYFRRLKRDIIRLNPSLTRVQDPKEEYEFCFSTPVSLEVPIVTLHFAGRADMTLTKVSIFSLLPERRMTCLAMKEADKVVLLGYKAQWNFKVGFNLGERTVSFKPITDCSAERIDMI
ncbi:hypothetical protein BT93_G2352 [Corymbia citriodora subsp. variegata]|nr:hypothetical protein BT93_G2352 [Corymbia citriodora subsp. variegata]